MLNHVCKQKNHFFTQEMHIIIAPMVGYVGYRICISIHTSFIRNQLRHKKGAPCITSL